MCGDARSSHDISVEGYRLKNYHSYWPYYNYICSSNTYALEMPHLPITSCVAMRQLCRYIHPIWCQCDEQCDQEYWYTFITHYWHMHLNKFTHHIAHVSLPHLLWFAYRTHVIVGIHQKSIHFSIYLQHYCKICVSNAIYMQHAQFTWCTAMGKYVNICAIYEIVPINDVARITVHRWCKKMTATMIPISIMTTMLQLDCIDWAGQICHHKLDAPTI